MSALLTVGSTQFKGLVDVALSEPVLDALEAQGIARFVVQFGTCPAPAVPRRGGIAIEAHSYIDDIERKMSACSLVISHAGAGSILAALRGSPFAPSENRPKLIIVANDSLMDSHQSDLANKLNENGWATIATPGTLAEAILKPQAAHKEAFPSFKPGRISSILDFHAGYTATL